MASAAARGDAGPGWIATAVGVLVLVVGGFLAGLLVGIVGQEPELVAGHLSGRSEVVDWSADPLVPLAESEPVLPAVSAGAATESEYVDDIRVPTLSGPDEIRVAEPPALMPIPAMPAGEGFSIQVGAFAEGKAADSLASSLVRKGYPAYVTPSAADAAQRWRVRVGPLDERATADELALRLKREEQLPTWVLSPAAR